MKWRLIASMVAVILTACGSSPSSSSATGPKVRWDMLLNVPLTHPLTKYFQDFASEVSANTNGQITITLRPPGELPYKQSEYATVVGSGSVALADASAAFIVNSKIAAIPGIPFLVDTPDEYAKARPILRPYLDRDLAKLGDHLLFDYTFPVQTVWGEGTPVKTLGDLKGRKMRASTTEQSVFLQKIGAQPVALQTAEVPQALQLGTVSGVLTAGYIAAGGALGSFKWGYLLPVNMAPGYIVVNQNQYSSLSSDEKKGLEKASTDIQDKMLKNLVVNDEKAAETQLANGGVVITTPQQSDIEAATNLMKPYWTQWGDQAGGDAGSVIKQVEQALGKS
ncbi:MAG: TRAP transporter substrate-binding protein [Candidatus Dormibacteraceae bacterium]